MFSARLTQRTVTAFVLTALLVLATFGAAHAYAHDPAGSTECATCIAVHAAPVRSVVTTAAIATLIITPCSLTPSATSPQLVHLARPCLRGPPALD